LAKILSVAVERTVETKFTLLNNNINNNNNHHHHHYHHHHHHHHYYHHHQNFKLQGKMLPASQHKVKLVIIITAIIIINTIASGSCPEEVLSLPSPSASLEPWVKL